ncbi:hypothetical protein OSB04_026229 [Centaurea solstitialis]|uniref:F-box associated beta-propeller type 1 domain-containing protein n=1 Tax=Centaurea solstitialis TaxID=347529 RepID=A0AA38SWK8_9ASTR|nr:hypothetical protein OSB04_026229 [Centaurea solstitialis]
MGSHEIETPLPQDILLIHILPRLPGKSVHRFMCVCKKWWSFLTTPTFAEMHHQHRHKLLIALSTTTPCKFSTIDLEAPQDGLTVGRPLPFEASHENLWIIESLHGLVCLCMNNKCNGREYSDIILWNPLTGEYKITSRPNYEECFVTTSLLFGFYYIYNDYRLLLVTKDHNVYIYSLKSDSWRKVETTQDDLNCLPHTHSVPHILQNEPCVFLNEKLYFISTPHTKISKRENFIIIKRFDVKTEKWRKIAGPYINGLWKHCLSFLVVRGCIHLYLIHRHLRLDDNGGFIELGDSTAELWRMDGEEDWTKVVTTYNLPNSHPRWFILHPLHLMKNGNWVMHVKRLEEFYEADLEMRTKKEVYSYSRNAVFITPKGKYIETLGINLSN